MRGGLWNKRGCVMMFLMTVDFVCLVVEEFWSALQYSNRGLMHDFAMQ